MTKFGTGGKHSKTPVCHITWGTCSVATRSPDNKAGTPQKHRCMDEIRVHQNTHCCMFCQAQHIG